MRRAARAPRLRCSHTPAKARPAPGAGPGAGKPVCCAAYMLHQALALSKCRLKRARASFAYFARCQNRERRDDRDRGHFRLGTKPMTKSWRDVLQIHPAAELFPLMTPDELRVLGEDIKKNGLTSPIVLWRSHPQAPAQLLDGRNRLDAIEIATG